MRHLATRRAAWAGAALAVILVVALTAAFRLNDHPSITSANYGRSCEINLDTQVTTCVDGTEIYVDTDKTVRATVPVGGRVRFTVTYGSNPAGWTVNIGDSATNDGYAGDAGTQSNDAELQLSRWHLSNPGQYLVIYGNDNTPSSYWGRILNGIPDPNHSLDLHAGSVATFTISNNQVDWSIPGNSGSLSSPYLFALNGQSDSEGPVNYDIYASFNRVITGRGDRTGSGVTVVKAEILP